MPSHSHPKLNKKSAGSRQHARNRIVWSLYMHESLCYHERPYDRENTASRLICEVKHVPVWIVVRWGTTREVQMLFFLFLLNFILSFLNLFFYFSYSLQNTSKKTTAEGHVNQLFSCSICSSLGGPRRAQRMKMVKLKYKREHLYSSSSSFLRLPFVFLSSSFSFCPFSPTANVSF